MQPVWQRQASLACHRFNGAPPNQEWPDQRGQARVWPTCQQNSSLFSRAPIQKFSSAARRQARRRRRKISGTSPTCRFLDEIRPSRAPACSPCGPAPAASRAACSAWLHRHRDHGTFNLRHANAPSGQCCGALRAWRGAQTVMARRVHGAARKALLQYRGNGSKRHRLNVVAPRRGGHARDTFAAHGGGTQLPISRRAALSVMKPAGKEAFNVEKKRDVKRVPFHS